MQRYAFPFLLSPLAGKRDIVVTILVRCMCMRQCVRPNLSGPLLVQ